MTSTSDGDEAAEERTNRPGKPRRNWTPLPGRSSAPTPLRNTLDNLAATFGLTDVASIDALFLTWDEIVGPDLASRCRPTSLRERVLTVAAVDQQWATELQWMTGLLIERCCETLGEGTVESVRITNAAKP